MAAGDLRVAQSMPSQLRHIVTETAVRNIAANAARHTVRACSYRGDGIAGQGGAVARSNTAKCTSDKANTAAQPHSTAAFHYRIAHIAVRLETVSEPSCKTGSCSRSSCRGIPENTACAAGATGESGKHPGGHQHFHAHAGTGLCYVQANGGQVAVKSLRRLQKR